MDAGAYGGSWSGAGAEDFVVHDRALSIAEVEASYAAFDRFDLIGMLRHPRARARVLINDEWLWLEGATVIAIAAARESGATPYIDQVVIAPAPRRGVIRRLLDACNARPRHRRDRRKGGAKWLQ